MSPFAWMTAGRVTVCGTSRFQESAVKPNDRRDDPSPLTGYPIRAAAALLGLYVLMHLAVGGALQMLHEPVASEAVAMQIARAPTLAFEAANASGSESASGKAPSTAVEFDGCKCPAAAPPDARGTGH
jgi:hypothetical protein